MLHLAVLERTILGGQQPVSGMLFKFRIGSIIFDVIFFEAGNCKFESYNRLKQFAVSDVDFVKSKIFDFPMFFKAFAKIDVFFGV